MANTVQVRFTKNNYNPDNYREGVVRVGFFEDSKYEGNKTVASVARINEFGLGVPKRSFMRPAVHRNRSQLIERLRSEYKKAIKELLLAAANSMSDAKSIHDKLESYYIKAMNFKKLTEFANSFCNKLF